MYTQVSQSDFIAAFRKMDPMDNFSYDGLVALYDWFEQYEEDTGERIELDVIAICCDFTEMSYDDLRQEYSNMLGSEQPITEYHDNQKLLNWLEDNTLVIRADDVDYSYPGYVLFKAF